MFYREDLGEAIKLVKRWLTRYFCKDVESSGTLQYDNSDANENVAVVDKKNK